MSLESLRFMLGGAIKRPTTEKSVIVRHTEEVTCIKVGDTEGVVPLPEDHLTGKKLTPVATPGHPIRLINLTTGARTQLVAASGSTVTIDGNHAINFVNPKMQPDAASYTVTTKTGDHIRIFWEVELKGENSETESAIEVTISPDTYPGTYRVIGDTFMRSEKTGADEPFQFIIGKAKVLSEVTITLEAEGDPSTFEMSLNVLRSTNDHGENEMMKLIRYSISESDTSGNGDDYGSVGPTGTVG